MLFVVDPHLVALPADEPSAEKMVRYISKLSQWSTVLTGKRNVVLSETCALAIQNANCLPDPGRLQALWYLYGDKTIEVRDVFRSIRALLMNTPYLEDRIPIMREIEVDEETVATFPDLFERVVEPIKKPFKGTVGCVAYAHLQATVTDKVCILTEPIGSWVTMHVDATVESSNGSEVCEAHIPLRTHPDMLEDEHVDSWASFMNAMRKKYKDLTFCPSVIDGLSDPYDEVIAQAADHLLGVLNELKQCFDVDGQRTEQGEELIQKYFRGSSAKFSDESNTKKSKFQSELTFRITDDKTMFCPFHGKINRRRYRLHFSWPITPHNELYVVYLGPKITKD